MPVVTVFVRQMRANVTFQFLLNKMLFLKQFGARPPDYNSEKTFANKSRKNKGTPAFNTSRPKDDGSKKTTLPILRSLFYRLR